MPGPIGRCGAGPDFAEDFGAKSGFGDESDRSRPRDPARKFLEVVGRQEQNHYLGVGACDAPARLQSVDVRQVDIHQDQVWA